MSPEFSPSRFSRLHLARGYIGWKLVSETTTNNPGLHKYDIVLLPSSTVPPTDLTHYDLKKDGSFVKPSFNTDSTQIPPSGGSD